MEKQTGSHAAPFSSAPLGLGFISTMKVKETAAQLFASSLFYTQVISMSSEKSVKNPKHSSFKKLNPFQERKVMTETCFCFDLWPLGTRAKKIIIFKHPKKPSIINICKTTQRFRQCQIYQLVKFSLLYLKTLKTRIVLFFLIKWKLPLDLSDTRCSPLSWFELETLCQIKISYINF